MKKGEKRKKELLETAYELFTVKGYENTSVDEIIDKAGIAKGTYYYYFSSKEQMLEEVIDMMLEKQIEKARFILEADIPIPQKIVGIVASIRPEQSEESISTALHSAENLLMHEKINKKIVEEVTPLLVKVAQNGVESGVFDCDNLPERIKIILVLSNELFNEKTYTQNDIEVFIDVVEKILGAKKGTMAFIKDLIV